MTGATKHSTCAEQPNNKALSIHPIHPDIPIPLPPPVKRQARRVLTPLHSTPTQAEPQNPGSIPGSMHSDMSINLPRPTLPSVPSVPTSAHAISGQRSGLVLDYCVSGAKARLSLFSTDVVFRPEVGRLGAGPTDLCWEEGRNDATTRRHTTRRVAPPPPLRPECCQGLLFLLKVVLQSPLNVTRRVGPGREVQRGVGRMKRGPEDPETRCRPDSTRWNEASAHVLT